MPQRFHLSLIMTVGAAIIVSTPASAQVEPSASGGAAPDEDMYMSTPPPVSGMAYPSSGSSGSRSNFLNASVAINSAYVDNYFVNA
jgi:hypothetical protein